MDLLPTWPLLSAFLVASLVLAVTPGPGVLYIVARSVAQGRRSGLASVAGVAAGNLGNAVAASIGLAALFAMSSMAFTVVKYLGALYLVVLGLQALRTGSGDSRTRALHHAPRSGRVFLDGFVVALLNPKTTLFFAAFLPQFLDRTASPMARTLALGALFVAVAAITDTIYALAAGAMRPALVRAPATRRAGAYASGGVYLALGLFTALSGERGRN